ncbi:MAG: tetratricopeptide repeat protein [bacterium]
MQPYNIGRWVILILFVGVMAFLVGGMYWMAKGIMIASKSLNSQYSEINKIQNYPYYHERFNELLMDSNKICASGGKDDFYVWMNDAYLKSGVRMPGKEKLNLKELLQAEKDELGQIKDKVKRAKAETELGAWLHMLVRTTITKFSLDRGYEFYSVITSGERQCLLQSVLIAALLQEMGVDAGIEMVYKNPEGQLSNNGHVITLIKLPTGRDIIVDASHQEPFARHGGLLVKTQDYTYVTPVYKYKSPEIISYRATSDGHTIATSLVSPLDYGFTRSQFMFYRGERVVGGLLSRNPTKEGLTASANYLEQSVKFCPKNPLAVYTLGRTYRALGRNDEALTQFQLAVKLYKDFGWIPDGPRDALNRRR